MTNDILQRLASLRKVMSHEHIDAYIIPSSDAHLSEYTPEHWKGRRWISGFTGSAGTVVVTANKAGLWTDGRYFLQAGQQLEGTSIDLYKEGIPGTPSIEQFLAAELKAGQTVGIDGRCFPAGAASATESALDIYGIKLRTDKDLFDEAWRDRPEIPRGELFVQPVKYAGESVKDKIARVNKELATQGANATIITMLDELAWIFNLRGRDVECNPVGVAFGYVSARESVLFAFPEKITKEVRSAMEEGGVKIMPYEAIYEYIPALPAEERLLIDKKRITRALYDLIPAACRKIDGVSTITALKAIKNKQELSGVRAAMVRDGVALTRFFMWLEQEWEAGRNHDEVVLGEKLTAFRTAQPLYFGDSFDTICGYQDHGAIIHYRATPESAHVVKREGVLLLDSGAQYHDGTTDITRTVALSTPSAELKRDYTLVMKGHIAIATAQYLEGTRGSQIDVLARKALWDNGMNYAHGTGHGVGCFLNVHEGPQNIRMDENPTEMKIGMITSNEPGLYRSGKYGIRIENLVVTKLNVETEFGRFFGFETLTAFYFDNELIEKSLLTTDELKWYNDYQQWVYKTLAPKLTTEERAWLKEKTLTI